jgi:hypothetical protein
MAKKDNNVNQIETDIKAVAKTVGASLKRQGHTVPHSVVLNAVSASLNRRDWHKLKVAVSGESQAASKSSVTPVPDFEIVWRQLSDQDKFWAAVAALQGVSFTHTPEGWVGAVQMSGRAIPAQGGQNLKAAACTAMREFNLEGDCPATLYHGGNELGTALFHLTGNGYFSHFSQKLEQQAAGLSYPVVNARARFKLGNTEIECDVFGTTATDWYFPSGGETALWDRVVGSVNFRKILGFHAQETQSAFEVPATFWTDDRIYEVKFDAAPALQASHDDQLERILWWGTSDNVAMDAIALYMNDFNPSIAQGLNHVWALREKGHEMGFECQMDVRKFRQWMDANRRLVLARWFCGEQDVKLKTRTSNGGDTFYDWVKESSGGSEVKGWDFPTEEAALLDAYEKVGRQKGFIDRV